MGRLFAIPDIHGRYDLLKALLHKLYTEYSLDLSVDKIIFLGDMIDRGPQSKEVIDAIWELTIEHPDNVIALAGNHEWLAIDAHTKGERWLWEVNGGDKALDSFGGMMPDEYIHWMAQLPLYRTEPGFFFSHAPAPRENRRKPENQGEAFTREELTWTYHPDEFGVAREFADGVIGVCGHIHALRKGVASPRFYDHYIFADAGCGCAKHAPLVAIEVRSKEVIYARPE